MKIGEEKKTYYRIDVVDEKEIVTVCTTENKEEAERQYKVWNETHGETHIVLMFRMDI